MCLDNQNYPLVIKRWLLFLDNKAIVFKEPQGAGKINKSVPFLSVSDFNVILDIAWWRFFPSPNILTAVSCLELRTPIHDKAQSE